jgi:metal iron transporter
MSTNSFISLDPGNWATDMEGGSRFGYRLLFIILLSNIIAVFLQNLALRLGTVSGLDLASCSRRYLPYSINLFLYILAEIAIIATDIAEVIGSAIALNLLIPSLPLPAGVAITAVDVFIVLMFYSDDDQEQDEQKKKASVKMARYFEFFVMLLVAAVGTCFVIELAFSNVVIKDVMMGFLPTKEILTQPDILYVSIGILGATVMPHNLYLHSFIVQARCHGWRNARPHVIAKEDEWLVVKECGLDEFTTKKIDGDTVVIDVQSKFEVLRDYLDTTLKHHLHYGFADLIVALSVAFFVNCAILVVAAANFYYGPESQEVSDLFSAHGLLLKYLGPPAATVFALALLFAGQSSTLTATLAGQGKLNGK